MYLESPRSLHREFKEASTAGADKGPCFKTQETAEKMVHFDDTKQELNVEKLETDSLLPLDQFDVPKTMPWDATLLHRLSWSSVILCFIGTLLLHTTGLSSGLTSVILMVYAIVYIVIRLYNDHVITTKKKNPPSAIALSLDEPRATNDTPEPCMDKCTRKAKMMVLCLWIAGGVWALLCPLSALLVALQANLQGKEVTVLEVGVVMLCGVQACIYGCMAILCRRCPEAWDLMHQLEKIPTPRGIRSREPQPSLV